MTIETQPAIDGADTPADPRAPRLARRAAELYATDRQFAEARPLDQVIEAVRQPGLRLAQILATVMTGYADRPALGVRAHELVTDAATGRTSVRLLPRFETITYRDLWSRVGAIAGAWHHDPDTPVQAGDFVCLLGFTSGDYAAVDIACIHLGAVSVPLQTSAPVAQLAPIIADTEPRILAASIDLLDTAVEAALAGTSPGRLLVFDYHPDDDDQRDRLESARRRVASAGSSMVVEPLGSVLERAATLPPAPVFVPDADDDPLATIFYTSGSTGTPKGAMYTERMFTRLWLPSVWPQATEQVPAIRLNYMPMSHIYGRAWLAGGLISGGTSYFAAENDLSTLFEDIALVRPTIMNFVPRVCDMVFQKYRSEIDRRTTEGADPATLDAEVGVDLRENFFGGRVLGAICGTAPLSADMTAFIESCLDVHLGDGYGSTEAGMVLVESVVQRPPVIDYKLVDVPDLGYFRTDTPHPRGELLVKTASIIPGYYKRPEATAEIFDEQGYYKTGDIMAEIGPDRLVYVDRRSNVLKLSQGEFVAVSRLEAIFSSSPLVGQIFVYGSSERAYLLAVVVPNEDSIAQLDNPGGTDTVRTALSESLRRIAHDAELNSYEIPRDFLIETEPFSTQNGLLSGVGKLLRPILTEHYGERLERRYVELADGQADELRALRRTGRDRPVLETVRRAAQATLGCSPTALSADAHFTDLGGDSLSALSFSNLLREIYGVDVPVGVIVGPVNDLAGLASYLESELGSVGKRPTFASVHGPDSTRIRADDLTLDKFIDTETLTAATAIPRPTCKPNTVLLTGANGYLGRFLCLAWLERMAETGGTLICLVRGNDAAASRARLDAAFDSGDAELVRHFQDLAAEHLEVLAGDIGEPNLGLDNRTWRRLADAVDLIVHPAALVNHMLPYRQLFGPNVVGTAELIRMAVTTRMKPVNYLSTVAVAAQVEPTTFDEDGDIRMISAVRSIDDSYANGYGNSKWAGEVLLREAHDLCGLPVTVFRSDMILAHSRYAGQLNVPDVFTRLLLSLVATGIAPRSFYEADTEGRRARAHYDGLPADFTAEAITTLGQAPEGFQTFDVANPHDDGISLDDFVDWLIEDGHPIVRIDDYDEWFGRFESSVRALPEKQRQHSLLPLLDAYRSPGRAIRGSAIPTKRFQAAVQAAAIGPDKDVQHLTASLISKYVADLHLLKLL